MLEKAENAWATFEFWKLFRDNGVGTISCAFWHEL